MIGLSSALSQNSESYQVRKVNLNALELLDKYERRCEVFSRSDYEEFVKLFSAKDAKIVNDVLPDNSIGKQVTPKAYTQLMIDYFRGDGYQYAYNSSINVIHLSPIEFNGYDQSGNMTIIAEKAIDATHKEFDTRYVDTLRLAFQIKFDSPEKGFSIKEINLKQESYKYAFVEAYRKPLIGKNPVNNDTVILRNDSIKLDSSARTFVKEIKEPLSIKLADETVYESSTITPETIGAKENNNKDPNVTEVSFREPYWFWSINAGAVPFGTSPVIAENSSRNISTDGSNQFSYRVGGSAGLILYQGDQMKYTVKTGINYVSYQYNATLNRYQDQYLTQDPDQRELGDGNDYQRIVELSDVNEDHDLSYLSFPLIARARYHLQKDHFIRAGIGGSYYSSLSGKRSTEANATYSGLYPDLYNIKISENGVYDFGDYDLQKDQTLSMADNFIAGNVQLGWQLKLTKRSFLNLDLTYKFGLSQMFNEKTQKLSRDNTELRSLTNTSGSFYLRSFSLNVGYSMNM
jgi:hypothetical protein